MHGQCTAPQYSRKNNGQNVDIDESIALVNIDESIIKIFTYYCFFREEDFHLLVRNISISVPVPPSLISSCSLYYVGTGRKPSSPQWVHTKDQLKNKVCTIDLKLTPTVLPAN
jgi:hypothetical protein